MQRGKCGNSGVWQLTRHGRWLQERLAPTAAPLICCGLSNICLECYQWQIMTGWRWYTTRQRHGRFRGECRGSWAGRRWGCGCLALSLNPLYNRCWSLVQRYGWLPSAWDGSWRGYKARYRGDWWEDCHIRGCTEDGITPWWRRRERRWVMSGWKPAFGEGTYFHTTDYVPVRGGEE